MFFKRRLLKGHECEEKIALLEDMLELDEGTLNSETELSSIDEYDSMVK